MQQVDLQAADTAENFLCTRRRVENILILELLIAKVESQRQEPGQLDERVRLSVHTGLDGVAAVAGRDTRSPTDANAQDVVRGLCGATTRANNRGADEKEPAHEKSPLMLSWRRLMRVTILTAAAASSPRRTRSRCRRSATTTRTPPSRRSRRRAARPAGSSSAAPRTARRWRS